MRSAPRNKYSLTNTNMLGLPVKWKSISKDHNFNGRYRETKLYASRERDSFNPKFQLVILKISHLGRLGRSRNFSVASEEMIQVRDTLIILEDITLVMVNYTDKQSK